MSVPRLAGSGSSTRSEWSGSGQSGPEAMLRSLRWPDLLGSLGVGGLQLELNSLGTTEDRQAYRNVLVAWLEQRAEVLDPDSQARLSTNPLRILDSKNKDTQALLEGAPTLADSLADASHERFAEVQCGLTALGIPFRINPRLVRGLDYYSHTAFEITSDQLGAQATVCGGGRYDGLIADLGGSQTPAIGWALGMERLLLVLEAAAQADPQGVAAQLTASASPEVYLVNRGEEAERVALALARDLRAAGLRVDLDASGSAFGKQFKRADRSGAPWALVLGDEEAERGEVRLKALKQQAEESTIALTPLSAIVERLVTP